jgi:hypothetical protein
MNPGGIIRLGFAHVVGGAPTALWGMPRHLGGGGDVDISLGRIVVAFVICIIVAVLAALLIRQRGGRIDLTQLLARTGPRTRRINIVEMQRLNPYNDICLVRYDGREYLLVLQQGGTQILRERDICEGSAL